MKNLTKSLGVIVLATIIVSGVVYAAGSLNPSLSTVTNTSYTLTDLDNLKTNTRVSPGSGQVPSAPAGNPALTFKSISDVYNNLTTELNKLTPDKIAEGTTVFGVTGTLRGTNENPPLVWSRDMGVAMNYANSVQYCTRLMPDGVTVGSSPTSPQYWRLPTKDEVAREMKIGAIDGLAGFRARGFTSNLTYFTITLWPQNPTVYAYAPALGEMNGSILIYSENPRSKQNVLGVRCVHDN